MKPPITYFEWKQMLDKFAQGDDTVIQLMNEGTITMDAGTVVRFSVLIEETYKKRKQIWSDKFNSASQNQIIRSPSDFAIIISQAKNGLKSIIVFVELKPFSNDLKKTLKDDLQSFVENIKKSLKENAFKDRSNQMNSLLLAFDSIDINKVAISNINSSTEIPSNIPNKRRIIF